MNLFNMYTNNMSINVLVHGRESKKDFASLLDGKKYD